MKIRNENKNIFSFNFASNTDLRRDSGFFNDHTSRSAGYATGVAIFLGGLKNGNSLTIARTL